MEMNTKPILYNKTSDEIKESIDKISAEVWSCYTDEPGYFCGIDPVDGNEYAVIYSSNMGIIEQLTGIPKRYFGKD